MSDDPISRVMAAVPDPMLALDRAGRITAANAAARAMFGDWIVDRPYAAVLRQPALRGLIERGFATGEGGETRYSVAGQTGEAVYRARLVATEPGRAPAAGLILHLDDMTPLREAAEQRRGFVANVSHELRTPLTAILGFIETIRGPARNDPEATDRFLGIMEEEARRMNRIVSDLLSLSRVEGEERMRPDDLVDLGAVLDGIPATLRTQAEEGGNRIEIERPEGAFSVLGDADQLRQVFLNLTENALKYGGTGKPVRLVLREEEAGPTLGGIAYRVDVIDQGEGIEARHLPRLTERFYRVDTHRSREMGGTGLGLAIVKHIVNRHRGRLRIASEMGRGSTFTVLLPRA